MTETEIERLVVRLVGDSTSYVKMLTDAQKKTQDAAHKVEEAASRIEKFQKRLEGFGQSASRVFASVGVVAGLKEMYEKFDKADDAITELSAVIKMNGNAVSEVLPKYQEFAKEMAKVTTSSKGAVIEMLRQAEALGLSGEKAQKAVKSAITLGAIKDSDPAAFMRQAINFEKTGNAAGFARILGLMGEMEEDTTKAAEAMKLLEKNWALVIVKGEDGSAKLQRSLNTIGSVAKDAGEIVASVVEPIIDKIATLADKFSKLNPTIRSVIVSAVLLIAAIEPVVLAYGFLSARVTALITTMTVLKQAMIGNVVMQNTWTNAVEQGSKRVGSAIVQYKAQIVVMIALAAAYAVVAREQAKLSDALAKSSQLQSKLEEANRTQSDSFGDIKQHNQNVAGKEDALRAARQRFEEADEAAGTKRFMPILGSGWQADYDTAKQQVDEAEKLYDQAKESRDKFLQAQEMAAKGPGKELQDSIQGLNADLNKQIQTLGMSEAEIKIYELRIKAAGDATANADLDVAEYNARMLEAAKAQKAANDSAKDLVKALEFQVKTWGMSASEALRYKLTLEGVDAATIDQAVALQDQLDGLEAIEEAWNAVGEKVKETKEHYQALNAVVAGGADAAQLIYQYANQFGSDTGAVNKAATLRGNDFGMKPGDRFVGPQIDMFPSGVIGPYEGAGPQIKGADALKETEKKLDDLKTVLEQIRDKEQVTFEGADITA